MAETEASSLPENKEKAPCRFGSKCRRRKCKYLHPPPADNVNTDDTAQQHDPSMQPEPKAGTNATHNDKVKGSQEHVSKTTQSKKKATKPCKFGNACQRKKCPFLHPANAEEITPSTSSPNESVPEDEAMAKNTSSQSLRRHKGSRQAATDSPGSNSDNTEKLDSVAEPQTKQGPLSPNHRAKSSKRGRCFRGAKCRRPHCPFQHPQDSQNGQQENVVTMDVATLETTVEEVQGTAIPLAADLEDSLVAEAQQKQQHSPVKKSNRRKKRDKEAENRRRRQEEEDRLIQEEEERLRLQEEEEELHQMLQEQERQRQAEAEAELQRQADAEQERRLSAEKARLEIDLIRQEMVQKEEAKRQAEVLGNKQEREVEELKNPERVRAEREALERFKKAHEEQKKSEEAARRLEEEERMLQNQQDNLIRREREAEAEIHGVEQKKSKYRRRAKAKAHRREEADKAQEEADLRRQEPDEERERYKAERKAAKKERRRLEREAKEEQDQKAEGASMPSPGTKEERTISFAQSPTGSNEENVGVSNAQNDVEDEAAKKRRWQEELRRQKERAAEKKEKKQKLRRERLLEDLECQTHERTQFWQGEIADEKETVELLVQLCGAEFCRKNPDVDRQTLLADADVMNKLKEAAQETYRIVCKADIHSRVVVRGMKQQDLNDRTGTIQSWDEGKGKFYVGLDTKKGKNTQYLYLLPGNLEALPLSSPRKGKKKGDPVHMVFIASLFEENELMVDVYKNEVDEMKKALPDLDNFLETLMQDRDREEREAKELEEEELRQEEEARRRRAEQRHREHVEWERKQREYEEHKAEYQEWRRQQREEKKARAQANARGEREHYDEREHSPYCSCPRCEFENMFSGGGMGMGGGRGRGPSIFFSFGPGGPGFFFSYGDDDFDDDYEDQWDREWERLHEEELAEKNAEAAETLGVEVDATDTEIKRVFRKKARKYHPDSYRADNHEDGMTKDEAEEHFKELSNAYDHLMSNFDEDSDSDEE